MASTSNSKKNGKKVKVVTPELEAEAVGTPETRGATAFGLSAVIAITGGLCVLASLILVNPKSEA